MSPQIIGPATETTPGLLSAADKAKLDALTPGSGDLNYTFVQNSSSATWSVTHNLGKFPSVSVVDSAGTTIVPDNVEYLDTNSLVITFAAPMSGSAFLN